MSEASSKLRWPHRMAWVLCCATFVLLWVGGLITSTDAGMAVPDWPGTYGYNMFLYPWQTWMFGPWDLLVEHGHRLFASLVGLLTIALVIVFFRSKVGPRLRWLSIAALGLVIFQGVLGGLRVEMNERMLAFCHGATGPLFFALTAALVALTASKPAGDRLRAGGAWTLAALVYLQLLAGAALRHTPEDSSFTTFSHHAITHAWGAVIVSIGVLLAAFFVAVRPAGRSRRLLAGLMVAVVAVQVSLGVATWIARYRLPEWAQQEPVSHVWDAVAGRGTMSAPTAEGWTETHVVTAHSATGSLLLALATGAAVVAGWPRSSVDPSKTQQPPSSA